MDGWDCSFTEDRSRLPPCQPNKSTPAQLLHGFFRFYAGYALGSKVVMPRTGEAESLAQFSLKMEDDPKLNSFKVFVGRFNVNVLKVH